MKSITSIPPLLPRNTKSNRSSFRSAGGSRTEKERKSEKLSLVCVLKRQFCGCFQPKLESEKETEDSRAFDNLSPNTKKRPLDYKVLKQTQVFSGKKWGTIHFIRDLDPALSEPFKNSRPSVSAQHDALLQENLTDCGFCLAHPKFPAGVYSKIDVKPLKTYKNTDDSIVNRPFEAIVQFGLWRDEQDFLKICEKGNHTDCRSISRTAMCCLQSYKRGRRKLPFNLFRSSSKLDFEIVVVDVLPDANPGSKPKVEVEVVNTGAHPIYVQLALHEQQLLFETNLLANDGKVDDTSFPTVYKKVESGESKRLFKGFNDESQDFYEKFFENSPNIPSQLFGSLNIIPQWCKASENLSSFFNSENYFTYSNQDCDSTLAEFFMLNLEWHREYFQSLQKLPSRRKPKARRQS